MHPTSMFSPLGLDTEVCGLGLAKMVSFTSLPETAAASVNLLSRKPPLAF